jgi:predicted outer membrane protein
MGYYRKKFILLGLLMAWFLGTGLLVAQVNKHTDGQDDGAFLQRVSRGIIWKIETGKIAGNNASAIQVREFGQRMATRYEDVDKELTSLSAKKNITISRRLDAASQNTLDYMSRQKGAGLDREYTSMIADDLARDMKDLRSAILYTQDPDVRAFTEKTLKKLEEDRRSADSILMNLPLPVLK